MALMSVAGIPWLAGIIGSLFTVIFKFISKYLTKKFAIFASFVVGLLALYSVFYGVISTTIAGLSYVVPPEWGQFSGYVLPANAIPCLTAIMTAHIARYVFAWNTRILQYKLGL